MYLIKALYFFICFNAGAALTSNAVPLKRVTENEFSNSHLIAGRNTNSIHFFTATNIPSLNTTSSYTYSFTTEEPFFSFIDYRLEMAGRDGRCRNPVLLRKALLTPLVYFTAVYIDNKVRLSWNTENEMNVKGFDVERSMDGANFLPVKSITAQNNPGQNYYVFFDNKDLSGSVYYRLKITNSNGSFLYSDINKVNIKRADNLKIIPNLVTDNVNVFHAKGREGAKIEIYSFDGRKMLQLPVSKNAVQTNINTGAMQAGAYNLVFVNNDKVEFVKFIKQ